VINTRLTSALDLQMPIVLAPMNHISDARLARAVTQAGGLGLLGGGYGDPAWLKREFDRAKGTRVGCGLITWSLANRPELLDLVLSRQPAAVFLSFGDPTPFVEQIHAAGVPLLCQVCDLNQARQAIDAGADVLVTQGGEAGGHGTGTRSTFTLVPEVADLVAERAPDTLVLAAGGVADGRGLAAVLALGADGAVVGTRLWASQEAPVNAEAHRRALAASSDDTVRSSVFDIVRGPEWNPPYDGRLLRNDFIKRWHGHEDELRAKLAEDTFRAEIVAQNLDGANSFVGEDVGLIHEVLPVATILQRMVREAREASDTLARRSDRTGESPSRSDAATPRRITRSSPPKVGRQARSRTPKKGQQVR
jgi:nitronate monooxygenase